MALLPLVLFGVLKLNPNIKNKYFVLSLRGFQMFLKSTSKYAFLASVDNRFWVYGELLLGKKVKVLFLFLQVNLYLKLV